MAGREKFRIPAHQPAQECRLCWQLVWCSVLVSQPFSGSCFDFSRVHCDATRGCKIPYREMPAVTLDQSGAGLASAADLPAELVVQVAKASSTALFLTTISGLCHSWRAAIVADVGLWRAATVARFPKVAAIFAAKSGGTLPWLEVYKLQLRSEQLVIEPSSQQDEHDASDFVISYELSFQDQVLFEETHVLPSWDEQEDEKCIASRAIWTRETLPQWLHEMNETSWTDAEPKLSIWITRDWKTVQICKSEVPISDQDGVWSFATIELNLGVVDMEVKFFEETGELRLRFQPDEQHDPDANLQIVHGLRAFQAMLDRV